tara:strand:+ start:4930 stop:5106 length:177 start_codon:yes stop_codon:yes gene_type:complete
MVQKSRRGAKVGRKTKKLNQFFKDLAAARAAGASTFTSKGKKYKLVPTKTGMLVPKKA